MRTSFGLWTTLIAAALIATVALTFGEDYRWVGHAVAGLAAGGYLVGAVVAGAALCGRFGRRPASAEEAMLHRRLGVACGAFVAGAMGYGLFIRLLYDRVIFATTHAWFAAAIALVAMCQIVLRIVLKRSGRLRVVHRWTGYGLVALFLIQVVTGILMPQLAPSETSPRSLLPWLAPAAARWQADGIIGEGEYFSSRIVDDGNMEIHYRTDGRDVYVGLRAKTTGWVGVGIEAGQGEGMRNASIVFAYVRDGDVKVFDSFGTGLYTHAPDSDAGGVDDITEFGGREEGGVTVVEFKRPVDSGDIYDLPFTAGLLTIIWAYGADDDSDGHVARGRIEIEFR